MIDIDSPDLQQLALAVSDLERRFSDYTGFWNDFAVELVVTRLREVFDTEGYGTWSALDPAYAEAKAGSHPGQGILQRSGAYREAATTVGHPGNVLALTPTVLMLGVGESYIEALAGDNYPERHELGLGVSERQVFGLLADDVSFDSEISELLDRWSSDEISEVERAYRL